MKNKKLVVDANIIVSALLKDSTIRKLLLFSKHDLYSPDFLRMELYKYLDLFSKKLKKQKAVKIITTEELVKSR